MIYYSNKVFVNEERDREKKEGRERSL